MNVTALLEFLKIIREKTVIYSYLFKPIYLGLYVLSRRGKRSVDEMEDDIPWEDRVLDQRNPRRQKKGRFIMQIFNM